VFLGEGLSFTYEKSIRFIDLLLNSFVGQLTASIILTHMQQRKPGGEN
jgi:hypothetical protein